jgi:hypothetical protein
MLMFMACMPPVLFLKPAFLPIQTPQNDHYTDTSQLHNHGALWLQLSPVLHWLLLLLFLLLV